MRQRPRSEKMGYRRSPVCDLCETYEPRMPGAAAITRLEHGSANRATLVGPSIFPAAQVSDVCFEGCSISSKVQGITRVIRPSSPLAFREFPGQEVVVRPSLQIRRDDVEEPASMLVQLRG